MFRMLHMFGASIRYQDPISSRIQVLTTRLEAYTPASSVVATKPSPEQKQEMIQQLQQFEDVLATGKANLPKEVHKIVTELQGAVSRMRDALEKGEPINPKDLELLTQNGQKLIALVEPIVQLEKSDKLLKQYNPKTSVEDKMKYLEALQEQRKKLETFKDSPVQGLEDMTKALGEKAKTVLADIEKGLVQQRDTDIDKNEWLVNIGWKMYNDKPQDSDDYIIKLSQINSHVEGLDNQIKELQRQRDKALATLGVSSIKEVTPELLKQRLEEAQKSGDLVKVAKIMEATLVLQKPANYQKLEDLQEVAGKLKDSQDPQKIPELEKRLEELYKRSRELHDIVDRQFRDTMEAQGKGSKGSQSLIDDPADRFRKKDMALSGSKWVDENIKPEIRSIDAKITDVEAEIARLKEYLKWKQK